MQLHRLVKLANVSHDIFQFFIYEEEKVKTKIAPVHFITILLFFSLRSFGKISTAQKIFTAYKSLVVKFFDFVVKFFLDYLLSMMESWGKSTSFL